MFNVISLLSSDSSVFSYKIHRRVMKFESAYLEVLHFLFNFQISSLTISAPYCDVIFMCLSHAGCGRPVSLLCTQNLMITRKNTNARQCFICVDYWGTHWYSWNDRLKNTFWAVRCAESHTVGGCEICHGPWTWFIEAHDAVVAHLCPKTRFASPNVPMASGNLCSDIEEGIYRHAPVPNLLTARSGALTDPEIMWSFVVRVCSTVTIVTAVSR